MAVRREHAAGVQWFFKEEIKSHGWYTAELRKFAVRFRRSIVRERGMDFLVQVADELFSGRNLEEKVFAVFLLEKQTRNFGDKEFQLFASWLDRVISWADHDALVHDLLAPMVAAEPARCREVFRVGEVAESLAAARGLRGADSWNARADSSFPQIVRLSNQLLRTTKKMNGAEGTGLAAARDGQGRSGAHRALPDEDSEERSATGAANSLRDTKRCQATAGSQARLVCARIWPHIPVATFHHRSVNRERIKITAATENLPET